VTTWSQDELREIVEADDLHVAPYREDGETYGTPTWIWCVEVDGDLYVRAYNGPDSTWFQAAMREGAGRIYAADRAREVAFEPADERIVGRVDNAYREKYDGSPYLRPMLSESARSATVRILPRESED